jgi:hypothetical protein
MIARIAVAFSTLAALASVGVLAGCDPKHPCDKGYYADHGFCYLMDAGNDWYLDASIDGEDGGVVPQNPNAMYGSPCKLQSDCGGEAPVCGGPMLPLCTTINCESAGCPVGWSCIDVSKYPGVAPGVISVCIEI